MLPHVLYKTRFLRKLGSTQITSERLLPRVTSQMHCIISQLNKLLATNFTLIRFFTTMDQQMFMQILSHRKSFITLFAFKIFFHFLIFLAKIN